MLASPSSASTKWECLELLSTLLVYMGNIPPDVRYHFLIYIIFALSQRSMDYEC